MKNYKLVNSEEMKKKCERLDLPFSLMGGWNISHSFMIIEGNKVGTTVSRVEYLSCDYQEITQADFLALPEPFNVGDWVIWNNNVHKPVVFCIDTLNEENEAFWEKNDDRYFDLDFCTKLTQEQIKILELEG